jgi:hypothetical protein
MAQRGYIIIPKKPNPFKGFLEALLPFVQKDKRFGDYLSRISYTVRIRDT